VSARRVGRVIEVHSLEAFDRLVAAGARRLDGWRVQDVDLRERSLVALDPAGALFLGCELTDDAAADVRERGAVVFPDVPAAPIDAFRTTLYTPDELYAPGGSYEDTFDAKAYAWSQCPSGFGADAVVARALHDAAIDAALDRTVAGQRVVGVMGGHAVARGDDEYREAAVLGRTLTRAGLTVATGGGPGAMEAANLGAYLADAPDEALAAACAGLAATPTFRPSVGAWVAAAFAVRRRWPGGDGGVGVPTWFYGHEPSNAFAGRIAKFVQNAVREATLLARCDAGIVFLPGAAGTVQEIFQDACENYYAEPPQVAPMVLVGVEHWTRHLPAWPLLQALATGRPMAPTVALVDTVAAAADAILH
jgi:predicted Rossmann-fold nucleotide-binding protein